MELHESKLQCCAIWFLCIKERKIQYLSVASLGERRGKVQQYFHSNNLNTLYDYIAEKKALLTSFYLLLIKATVTKNLATPLFTFFIKLTKC